MRPLPYGSGKNIVMRGAEEDDLEASMRPLPYGSGKAGINAPARCYTRRASMRPLPYGSGKRHQSLQAPHRRRLGFNEAAPLRKRKGALGQPQGVRRPPGFNEAAPLRKRKVRNALTRSVETSASMRPLPYGSGKSAHRNIFENQRAARAFASGGARTVPKLVRRDDWPGANSSILP